MGDELYWDADGWPRIAGDCPSAGETLASICPSHGTCLRCDLDDLFNYLVLGFFHSTSLRYLILLGLACTCCGFCACASKMHRALRGRGTVRKEEERADPSTTSLSL